MEVTIEEILAMDDSNSNVEEVIVPEWNNAKIMVVGMTAQERSDMEKRWYRKEAASDPATFRLDMMERTLKKHDRKTPFGTPDQLKQLMGKNAVPVERLFDAACRVSAWSKKDVEEITKN